MKYCNAVCKKVHKKKHKKDCEEHIRLATEKHNEEVRIAAELHDEKLFKQPPPHHGDCPICFLRLPTLEEGRRYQSCCGKVICSGCVYAPVYDNQGNIVAEKKCPFCRAPKPTEEESIEREKKRVEMNDPIAIYNIGHNYYTGMNGLPQDHTKASELWHRAAGLGYVKAFLNLGYYHEMRKGVKNNKEKATYYYELAAMMGDADARHNLGAKEANAGNVGRSLKHHMIATKGGNSKSLQIIRGYYTHGYATKEDYTKHYSYIKHTWSRSRATRGMKLLQLMRIIVTIKS